MSKDTFIVTLHLLGFNKSLSSAYSKKAYMYERSGITIYEPQITDSTVVVYRISSRRLSHKDAVDFINTYK